VIVSNQTGQATLREQNLVAKNEREKAVEADPRVREVLARFPGAKLVEVRKLAAEPPESDANAAGLGDDGFTGDEVPDDF
jgi:DNA polymerase-3 subunit gamma/tau